MVKYSGWRMGYVDTFDVITMVSAVEIVFIIWDILSNGELGAGGAGGLATSSNNTWLGPRVIHTKHWR